MKQIKGNYVYVMSADRKGSAPNKIGYSSDIVSRRSAMQIYHPSKVYVHYKFKCKSLSRCKRLESLIHMHLSSHNIRGEWFNLNASDCIDEINHIALKYRHLSIKEIDAILGRKKTSRCKCGCPKNCPRGCHNNVNDTHK